MHRLNFLRRILFNLWYFRKPPWDSDITPPELMDFIKTHPPGSALDLGCGTGTNVITLSKHGWDVSGVDFASKAIRIARRKAVEENIDAVFYVDDVSKLSRISGNFDLIYDIGCFHNLKVSDKRDYISGIGKFLNPGGTYMLYAFIKHVELPSETGITMTDIDYLSKTMVLVSRQNGIDQNNRESAWFIFHGEGDPE